MKGGFEGSCSLDAGQPGASQAVLNAQLKSSSCCGLGSRYQDPASCEYLKVAAARADLPLSSGMR